MSKYTPLRNDLQTRPRVDMELSFEEIEKILGFKLPNSAHEHNAWWSNEHDTHVQARAWMDAGWKVWHVRRSEEKVYFKPYEQAFSTEPAGGSDGAGVSDSATVFRLDDAIIIDPASLGGGVLRMLEDYREAEGGSLADAVVGLLDAMALERRRQLVEWFRANSPKVSGDSTELIREDRDAR